MQRKRISDSMNEPIYTSEIEALEKKDLLSVEEFKALGHFRLQHNIYSAKVAC